MAEKLKQVTVKGKTEDNRVILWERHADHENGEVVIVGDGKPYTVAETAAVKRLIGEGRLVEANAKPVEEEKREEGNPNGGIFNPNKKPNPNK